MTCWKGGGRAQAALKRFVTIPAHLLHKNGKHGFGRRQCTTHYKIEPIYRKIRQMLGKGPRERISAGSVVQWVGISVDEIIRATPSKVKFAVKRFPLLEARMHRHDCLRWLERNDYPAPPKSACIGCPFHDNARWRDLRDNRPDEWADAILIDKAIRRPIDRLGIPAMKAEQFLHAQRVPLDEVDLSTPADHGQIDLFNHECEGMCGV